MFEHKRKLISAFVFLIAGVILALTGKFDEVISNFLLLIYSVFVTGNSAERYTNALKSKFNREPEQK